MAVVHTDIVSEETYRRLALSDPNGRLELHHGQLREKPWMSAAHGDTLDRLAGMFYRQLDRDRFHLRIGHARLRRSAMSYYVPDIAVIPAAVAHALLERPRELDAYPDALPLVIEIWSPSTGHYDVTDKLVEYQARGDREIWYIHPYERTLTRWVRHADGIYAQSMHRSGIIHPADVPDIAIDLDELFAS
jgi:Uma2 family endonuclease